MTSIREFRIAVTVADLDRATSMYRDTLGLEVIESWDRPEGRGVVLRLPTATLELLDVDESRRVDEIEVGRRLGQRFRIAVEVDDVVEAGRRLSDVGAEPQAQVTPTPWGHRNLRMRTREGIQLTLFQT